MLLQPEAAIPDYPSPFIEASSILLTSSRDTRSKTMRKRTYSQTLVFMDSALFARLMPCNVEGPLLPIISTGGDCSFSALRPKSSCVQILHTLSPAKIPCFSFSISQCKISTFPHYVRSCRCGRQWNCRLHRETPSTEPGRECKHVGMPANVLTVLYFSLTPLSLNNCSCL